MDKAKIFEKYIIEKSQRERSMRRKRKKVQKAIAIAIVIAALLGALIYEHYTYSASSHWVVVEEAVINED